MSTETKYEFWNDMWSASNGKPKWQKSTEHPALAKHIELFQNPTHSNVLVPLCGKTKDLLFLANLGFKTVVGVEYVQDAIDQLAAEEGFQWTSVSFSQDGKFKIYSFKNLQIWKGDFFKFGDSCDMKFDYAFDRASIVAIDPNLRTEYAIVMAKRCKSILLVTFLYDQTKMQGPPFSVSEADTDILFSNYFSINLLERRDLSNIELVGRVDQVFELVSWLNV